MSGASAASGLFPAGDAIASSSGAAALDFGAVFEKAVAAVNDKQVAATQATATFSSATATSSTKA